MREGPGASSGELGGLFCSLFVFISTELSVELFTPLPIVPANPSDVLFPLDDHGAVQSSLRNFISMGKTYEKALASK